MVKKMIQYEELSDNAKKAIEQFRTAVNNGHMPKWYQTMFWHSMYLNNVSRNEQSKVNAFARSKKYWLPSEILNRLDPQIGLF